MKRLINRRCFTQIAGCGIACLFAFVAAPVFAQEAAVQERPAETQDDLPSAADVIEMNINSMGGRDALSAVTSMTTKSTMIIPGPAGEMEATIEMYQMGTKFLMVMDLPGMGQMKQGSDGETFWSDNPMMGMKIVEDGPEKDAMVTRFSQPFPQLTWGDFDGEITVVGKETVEDVACYKVDFAPTEGPTTTRYFAAEGGHVVKEELTQESPMGPMNIETYPSDYKAVNGITVPFKNVTSTPQGEMEVSFDEYKINEDIDVATFALPENVQKMVEEAAGDEKEATDGEDG